MQTKTNLIGQTLDQIRQILGFKTVGQMKPIFGKMTTPLVGTKILSRPLDHFMGKGIEAHAIIVVNEDEGTFTAINLYKKTIGNSAHWTAGEHYDPKWNTNPITDKAKGKWDEKGYEEVEGDKFWPVICQKPTE